MTGAVWPESMIGGENATGVQKPAPECRTRKGAMTQQAADYSQRQEATVTDAMVNGDEKPMRARPRRRKCDGWVMGGDIIVCGCERQLL